MEKIVTRARLYSDIWTLSFHEVANTYTIKPDTLRAICQDHNIPLPNDAYWSAKKDGKEVFKKPLPNSYLFDVDLEKYRRKEKREQKVPRKSFAREIEKEILGSLDRSRAPLDRMVEEARTTLTANSEGPNHDKPVSTHTNKGQLNIEVYHESIHLVCRFMNQLVATLHIKGYSLYLKNGTTYIHIGEQLFQFLLREKGKRVITENKKMGAQSTFKQVSSGVFVFRVITEADKKEWELGGGTLAEEADNLVEELKKYSKEVDRKKRDEVWQKQEDAKKPDLEWWRRKAASTFSSPIRIAFINKDIAGMIRELNSLIGDIPYDLWKGDTEAQFHLIFHTTMSQVGLDFHSESHSSHGRIDIIIKTDESIYGIEFKLDGTAQEALDQILQKKYLQRFQSDPRDKIAIGINFSSAKREVDNYVVKRIVWK